MKTRIHEKEITAVIVILLCIITALSLIAIFYPASNGKGRIADIYQNGELLTSIPLDGAGTPYRFTVTGGNGCTNEIEVRHDSIGVVSASCPDRLCVRQGFIDHTKLPVVCLPNKLVIQLRDDDSATIDVVTY